MNTKVLLSIFAAILISLTPLHAEMLTIPYGTDPYDTQQSDHEDCSCEEVTLICMPDERMPKGVGGQACNKSFPPLYQCKIFLPQSSCTTLDLESGLFESTLDCEGYLPDQFLKFKACMDLKHEFNHTQDPDCEQGRTPGCPELVVLPSDIEIWERLVREYCPESHGICPELCKNAQVMHQYFNASKCSCDFNTGEITEGSQEATCLNRCLDLSNVDEDILKLCRIRTDIVTLDTRKRCEQLVSLGTPPPAPEPETPPVAEDEAPPVAEENDKSSGMGF